MKKLFVYIFAMLTLASCNSEGLVVDVQEQPEDPSRMSVEVEPIRVAGDAGSRSSIYYDKTSSAAFQFAWGGGESLGVFAFGDQNHVQQMQFNLVDNNNSSSLTRLIEPAQGINTLTQNTYYVAYYPYGGGNAGYSEIPIDYTGQVQSGHVDMSVYFNATSTSATDYPAYLASEKAASSHLGKYDYLCTAPQMTTYKKGVNFNLRRVGAISRFYIKSPAPYVYDSLIVFNPKLDFTITATMDASKSAESALTVKTTSHSMKLEFNNPVYDSEGNQTNEHGFDYTLDSEGIPVDKTFYRLNGTYIPYIIAYVMMGPINFDTNGADYTQLFLFAHEKGDYTKVHYFKAVTTIKPNLPANFMYRWSLNNAPDPAPIEFVETTIEDWKEATGFDNGDAGNGTGGW